MTDERYVVTRTIAAAPLDVFAVPADPTRHKDTEPGDWVRDAVDTEPITAVGQMFAVNMFLKQAGGDYVVHNVVTDFEKDRTIAWLPGQLDAAGKHSPGGWFWRYDLAPNGDGTDVTITYDWSGTNQEFRDTVGVPMFDEDFIEQSLSALDRTVTGRGWPPRRALVDVFRRCRPPAPQRVRSVGPRLPPPTPQLTLANSFGRFGHYFCDKTQSRS